MNDQIILSMESCDNNMGEIERQTGLIVTGSSGLLGREIKKLLTSANYPTSKTFDVTKYSQMEEYVANHKCNIILHAAAFTSPPRVEEDPLKAIDVNIIGTGNVVRLCIRHKIKLIYISTDYVFKGDVGNYCEEDPVYPVNKYAWSKLGGECVVRMHDNSLVIRTTFGPNVFPYDKAFIDQWTSRESVGDIAKKIVSVMNKDIKGVIHIGGQRRTVYKYAKSLDEGRDIRPISIGEVSFNVPKDTSLNVEKFNSIMSNSGIEGEDCK